MPGLLGGLAALFIVPGIVHGQLSGIVITIVIALAGGLVSGFLIRLTGLRISAHNDEEEFAE